MLSHIIFINILFRNLDYTKDINVFMQHSQIQNEGLLLLSCDVRMQPYGRLFRNFTFILASSIKTAWKNLKENKKRIHAPHSFQVEFLKSVTSVLKDYPEHKTYLYKSIREIYLNPKEKKKKTAQTDLATSL